MFRIKYTAKHKHFRAEANIQSQNIQFINNITQIAKRVYNWPHVRFDSPIGCRSSPMRGVLHPSTSCSEFLLYMAWWRWGWGSY